MTEPPWTTARRLLGTAPVVSQRIDGPTPMVVERYLFRAPRVDAPSFPVDILLTQFGGSLVEGGAGDGVRTTRVPSQSMLVPVGVPSEWHYSGAMDVGIFYLLGGGDARMQELRQILASCDSLVPISDALVSAAGQQLVHEMQQFTESSSDFSTRLAGVMIDQVIRALRSLTTVDLNPAHIQLSRMQEVLNYIRSEPTADLSVRTLADRAAVSMPHFFRIFMESTGMSPHQYILETRLELARRLLSQSRFPISHIAEQCGFSSASHFTTIFRRQHSTTPAKYRREVQRPNGQPDSVTLGNDSPSHRFSEVSASN